MIPRHHVLLPLVLTLASPMPATASPPTSLPSTDVSNVKLAPEAAQHNDLGMQAYRSGNYEAAYREFALAYASMDPRADLDGRDMVLASLRSALVKQYEKTGELKHLCIARTELVRHLESLLVTFGEDSDLEDIPGIKWRLRQLADKIGRHMPRLGEPTCDRPHPQNDRPIPQRRPPLPSTPLPAPRERVQRATIVGASALSVGGLLLGAMTYALLMRRASNDGLLALDAAAAMQPEGLLTREQRALADSLVHTGTYHRTAAIVTGVSGGVLAVTGITALIVGRVLRMKHRRVALLPIPQRTGGALLLTTHF